MELNYKNLIFLIFIFFNKNFSLDSPSFAVIEDPNLGKHPQRKEMQDAYDAKIEPSYAFFAIYDGHGTKGATISQFAKTNLLTNLLHRPEFNSDIKRALQMSFVDTYNTLDKDDSFQSGTTAVVAFIRDNKLYIAHVGDSRAVLANGKKIISTIDHKPNDKIEAARIAYLKGQIMYDEAGKIWRVGFNSNGKWIPTLAMSRALGDKYLVPYVEPWPDVFEHQLTKEDDFLILASDGIWDDVKNEEAIEIARKSPNVKEAAKYLVTLAKNRGSQDNISVIVINLKILKNEMRFLKTQEEKMYEEFYSPAKKTTTAIT